MDVQQLIAAGLTPEAIGAELQRRGLQIPQRGIPQPQAQGVVPAAPQEAPGPQAIAQPQMPEMQRPQPTPPSDPIVAALMGGQARPVPSMGGVQAPQGNPVAQALQSPQMPAPRPQPAIPTMPQEAMQSPQPGSERVGWDSAAFYGQPTEALMQQVAQLDPQKAGAVLQKLMQVAEPMEQMHPGLIGALQAKAGGV